jgi:hypothetical protein
MTDLVVAAGDVLTLRLAEGMAPGSLPRAPGALVESAAFVRLAAPRTRRASDTRVASPPNDPTTRSATSQDALSTSRDTLIDTSGYSSR